MSFRIGSATTIESLEIALHSGLYEIVRQCFAYPPYNENVTFDKVRFYFQRHVESGVLFLAYNESNPVGFIAALPLEITRDFKELSLLDLWMVRGETRIRFNDDFLIAETGFSSRDFQYVADLGVGIEFRRRGLAHQLFSALFLHFGETQPFLIRAIADWEYAYLTDFYRKLGFRSMQVAQTMQYQNSDGQIQSSERLIFVKLPAL